MSNTPQPIQLADVTRIIALVHEPVDVGPSLTTNAREQLERVCTAQQLFQSELRKYTEIVCKANDRYNTLATALKELPRLTVLQTVPELPPPDPRPPKARRIESEHVDEIQVREPPQPIDGMEEPRSDTATTESADSVGEVDPVFGSESAERIIVRTRRRYRGKQGRAFTEQQVAILERSFEKNNHQIPTDVNERSCLCADTGLTFEQIKRWFERQRYNQKLMERL